MARGTTQLTFEVNGRQVAASVGGDGRFSAEGPEGPIVEKTYEALKKKIRAAYRLVGKVAVPATLFHEGSLGNPDWDEKPSDDEFQDVELTGLHSRSRAVLYRDEDGEPGHTYGDGILRRLTADERIKLTTMRRVAQESERDYQAFKDSLKLDARTAINDATDALAAKEATDDRTDA